MKKLGRPTKETEAVNVRLELDVIQQLDDARRTEPDLPSRPEMIRRIMKLWFNEKSES